MHDNLNDALNEISDRHIEEAAAYPRRYRLPYRFGAIAASLALVILGLFSLNNLRRPAVDPTQSPTTPFVIDYTPANGLVVKPQHPTMAPYATDSDGWSAWQASRTAQYSQPSGYANSLDSFFKSSIPVFLEGQENAVCSPVNIYMALAMLAESTGGTSRDQILHVLDASGIDTLRTQAGHVWNAHYCDDGASTLLLANSLWLDRELTYRDTAVSTLASSYYASVFQGALGSQEMNESLRNWLNENTRGLLAEHIGNVALRDGTALALASTIYYQATWSSRFFKKQNTQASFHGIDRKSTCTFMNQTLSHAVYFYAEDFGAVRLPMEDGSSMWLILPDEGKVPEDLLRSGSALEMVMDSRNWEGQTQARIHLSVPKFDIATNLDLADALKKLGITDAFDPDSADFSAILSGIGNEAYLSEANHAARVRIDEEGTEAAAYTVMPAPGAAPPLGEEMDFVLDRPFLFVITSRDQLPLFAGTVYHP